MSDTSTAWRVARLGHTDVLVQRSLPILTIGLIWLVASRLAVEGPTAYVAATAAVLGLYASVFIHELGHRQVALAQGSRVPSMTLHILGGHTTLREQERTPLREVAVSGIGPAVSLALAGLLFVASLIVPPQTAASAMLNALAAVNLLLAAFNLLPAMPLDGGRVALGILWAITGRETLAMRIVAWTGRLIGFGVVGWLLAFDPSRGLDRIVNIVVGAFIVLFLWVGAQQGIMAVGALQRMRSIDVDDLLIDPDDFGEADPASLPTLPSGMDGEQLLRSLPEPAPQYFAVVDETGSIHGILDIEHANDAYRRTR